MLHRLYKKKIFLWNKKIWKIKLFKFLNSLVEKNILTIEELKTNTYSEIIFKHNWYILFILRECSHWNKFISDYFYPENIQKINDLWILIN